MTLLLTQTDWTNIKSILSGGAFFIVAMFILWQMFKND